MPLVTLHYESGVKGHLDEPPWLVQNNEMWPNATTQRLYHLNNLRQMN